MEEKPPILIVAAPVEEKVVEQYARAWFGDMVKIVVDVKRGILALGGELHADGEQLLLDDGSRQAAIWGANVYPFRDPAARIEYTALINIRAGQGNRSMEVQDAAIRGHMEEIVNRLLPPGVPP
jgi:hypothetical protein